MTRMAPLLLVLALLPLGACAKPPGPVFVTFDTGADKPSGPDEYVAVGRALQVLMADPDIHACVIGHADATGSSKLNQQLSLRRARKVREVFIKEGIAPSRLTVASKGASDPVASNQTEEGRAKNRRTEVFFFYPSRGSAGEQYGVRIEVEAE